VYNIAHTYYPQKGRLAVLGAGESGFGAAVLAKYKGFEVFVSDYGKIDGQYREALRKEQVDFEEGVHSLEQILKADLVVKSPGIPNSVSIIKELKKREIPVLSEIEFAAQYTPAKLIGITGSNGKTTTAQLTYEILKNAGRNVGLAGNIGKSFAYQVAKEKYDIYVLELSSFMLDDMFHFRANIAVLLNITPDHLDRYENDFRLYMESKFRIIQNQTNEDVFIYCIDDENIQSEIDNKEIKAKKLPFSQKKKLHEGAFIEELEKIIIKVPGKKQFEMNIEELSLKGKHNLYNNMASGLVAKVQELRNQEVKESMAAYTNVPHRLEHVAYIRGVNYINDSKATNVNSVWYALENFSSNIVLIMGGVDKGNDYEMLRELVKQKVKAIICIGKENMRIHETFEDEIEVIVNSNSMQDAVEIASHLADKGDTVLLSPACASFDWFKNFEDRGNQFKEAVMEL